MILPTAFLFPPTARVWTPFKKFKLLCSQNGACLVGKMIPHPVRVFCTHLEAPKCHIDQKTFCGGIFDITGQQIFKDCPNSARCRLILARVTVPMGIHGFSCGYIHGYTPRRPSGYTKNTHRYTDGYTDGRTHGVYHGGNHGSNHGWEFRCSLASAM